MAYTTFQKSMLALAIGGLASTAVAEDYTTGTMRGMVRDQAGNPVANAQVNVTSDRGVRRSVSTDADGGLLIPQLPIGTYTVQVQGNGYNALTTENVPIALGKSAAFTFTLQSLDQTIEEVYVTGVRQGSWDFNTTTTGITVDVGEIAARTPLAREAQSIILLAPGTSEGDTAFSTGTYGASGTAVSIAGSTVAENVYYVNGMNVTNHRTFIGGSTIPFDFYDQIEVKTGGYQAEFGRSTGGVTNAVSKSGSNEFHFGANVYWEPEGMYEQAPATYLSANQFDKDESLEYNLWASGAIIQDKLFFFGLFNPRDITEFDCGAGTCTKDTNDDPFYAAKIDFVPFDGHRLEFTYFSDDQSRKTQSWRYNAAGRASLGDATAVASSSLSDLKATPTVDSVFNNGGDNTIFKYTAALTDWATVSAMYGENNYKRENFSNEQPPALQDSRDTTTQTNSTTLDIGTWSVFLQEQGEDKRENWRFDADFYFTLAGDHHVRMGADQEDLSSYSNAFYSGDFRGKITYSSTSSTGQRWEYRLYNNEGGFSSKQNAWYVQDSWQPLDNLILNLGLRNESFENKDLLGRVYVETKDQLAPRFGFSWDPMSDGQTRVYGSYGDYYLPIATNTSMRQASEELYYREFYEAIVDGNGEPIYDADGYPELGPQIGSRGYFSDGLVGDTRSQRAEDFDAMYQSEWILGIERTFMDDWTVGLRYTKRDLETLVEDIAIDSGVIRWAEDNGISGAEYDDIVATFSGFHQYVITNPGKGMTVLLDYDLGGDGVEDFIDLTAVQLGYPKGSRTYEALDFLVDRAWDGKWAASMTYTWSKAEGNYEGSVNSQIGQDDAGITQDFDVPGLTDYSYGKLASDRTHRLKMYGAYAINEQLTVGANLRYESGRPMGCIGNHPTDYFAYLYGAFSWFCQGEPTPRGSQMKTDAITTVDVSLVWAPKFLTLPGDSELLLRVDVFNLFNADGVTDRREPGDIDYTGWNTAWDGEDPGVFELPDPDPNYGKPRNYQEPRRVRISAQYSF